jgi:hypothetical protein
MVGKSTVGAWVSPALAERLSGRAAKRGVSVSTLIAELLEAALNGGEPASAAAVAGSGLLAAVDAAFDGWSGPDVPLRREAARVLAREAERGGPAGVAAVRELLRVIHEHLGSDDPEWAEFVRRLETAE